MTIQPLPFCLAFGYTWDLDDPKEANGFVMAFAQPDPYEDAKTHGYEDAYNYALETVHLDGFTERRH